MGRSHDHWCEKCKTYYSPFDFPVCPRCGDEGVYDLNNELAGDEARDIFPRPRQAKGDR